MAVTVGAVVAVVAAATGVGHSVFDSLLTGPNVWAVYSNTQPHSERE